MFERATQRWHIGALYVARRMGRGGMRAAQLVGLLKEYASRDDFFSDRGLLSFAGHDFLAILAGVNEKTIRRTFGDLEAVGLVRVERREGTSNLNYLTLPSEAEDHLARCDLMIEKRRKARRKRTQSTGQDRSQVSTHPGQMGTDSTPKCPPYLEEYSEDNFTLKGIPSECIEVNKPRDLVEEKRLAEKLEALAAELSCSPDPLLKHRD